MAVKKKTEQDKIQDTLEYLRNQLELFMYKHYRLHFKGKIYANKNLKKERKYSKTTFLEDGTPEIDLDYDMLVNVVEDKDVKDKQGLKLRTIFREGVRIAMIQNKIEGTENGDEPFERELHNKGLLSYGKVAETGDYFHTYVCARCHNVQFLQRKKFPKTKDPSEKDSNKRTPCCNTLYFYEGKKYFTNKQLQKIDFLMKNKTT